VSLNTLGQKSKLFRSTDKKTYRITHTHTQTILVIALLSVYQI
jgi:hypothetical protein